MNMNTKLFTTLGVVSALALSSFTSCTQYQQEGAQMGALAGGVLGVLSGGDRDDIVRGVVLGAAAGTGIAAAREGQTNQTYTGNSSGSYNQAYNTNTNSQYSYAQPTGTNGYVKSPFTGKVIDVRGIQSGTLIQEPGTSDVFLIP